MHRVAYFSIPRDEVDEGEALCAADLDPYLSTHIIVASARIVNEEIVPLEKSDLEVYKTVIALKKLNPELKVLLCLVGTAAFSSLVKDPEAVTIFARNARKFLVAHGFDGLDLDWEFPAWPVLTKDYREKAWFTRLVQQLHHSLKEASSPPLLLTLAVGAPKIIVDCSYQVDQLAQYVDFVSMMGYDYHIFWWYLPFTGHNAPLTKRNSEMFCFATMNVEWTAGYWLKKGMPREKLVIGVPTYGRSWRLLREAWHSVGAPSTGEGMMQGVLTYPQAHFFIQEGAERHFDIECRVPFASRGKDWVSYDDPESIRYKTKWIKDSRFAGVMTWCLNSDDWAGICSGTKFELHKVIQEVLTQ